MENTSLQLYINKINYVYSEELLKEINTQFFVILCSQLVAFTSWWGVLSAQTVNEEQDCEKASDPEQLHICCLIHSDRVPVFQSCTYLNMQPFAVSNACLTNHEKTLSNLCSICDPLFRSSFKKYRKCYQYDWKWNWICCSNDNNCIFQHCWHSTGYCMGAARIKKKRTLK